MSDASDIENPQDSDSSGIAVWAITRDFDFVVELTEYNPLPNEPAKKIWIPFSQIKVMGTTGKGNESATYLTVDEGANGSDILVQGTPQDILDAVVDTSRQIAELIATQEELNGYDKSD